MRSVLRNVILLTSFSFAIIFCHAQPGTLDSSFGVNGRSTAFIGVSTPDASVLQPDGKILVAGNVYSVTTNNDFVVSRYLSNGGLDSSFGINGKNIVDFFSDEEECHAIALQPDGKIILAGVTNRKHYLPVYENISYFALARLNVDGKVDSSFGVNGRVYSNYDTVYNDYYCYAVTVQQDGKIVAAGYGGNGFINGAPNAGFTTIRYNVNGSVDSSYGTKGLQIIKSVVWSDFAYSVLIDADQKILLAGATGGSTNSAFELVRLKQNGILDSTFGTNGITVTDYSGFDDVASSMSLQKDGKIVLAGNSRYDLNNSNFMLARYLPNGKIDSSFATNGIAITNFGQISCSASSVVVQIDGKILVGGSNRTIIFHDSYRSDFALVRYKTTGDLDSSFGTNGKVQTVFSSTSEGKTLLLQPDNKIIFVGYTFIDTYMVTLLRYKNDEQLLVSINKNISVTEGNAGTTPAPFKIVLNRPSAYDVQVNYTTVNGNAASGSDYVAASGKTVIRAGKTSKTITVNVIGDNVKEKNEKFALVIGNPVNAQPGPNDTATCTIKNDDPGFASSAADAVAADTKTTGIKLYPNPVEAVLHIEGIDIASKTTVSIIDMKGNVVLKGLLNGNILNVQQFAAGVYEVRIETAGKIQSIKFVKE